METSRPWPWDNKVTDTINLRFSKNPQKLNLWLKSLKAEERLEPEKKKILKVSAMCNNKTSWSKLKSSGETQTTRDRTSWSQIPPEQDQRMVDQLDDSLELNLSRDQQAIHATILSLEVRGKDSTRQWRIPLTQATHPRFFTRGQFRSATTSWEQLITIRACSCQFLTSIGHRSSAISVAKTESQ